MAHFLDNKQRITLVSFLAYFVMSGMLAPIGIISGPMAELFDRPITDVTAQFGWLTFGNMTGAALALVIFDVLKVRSVFLLAYVLIIASLISLNFNDDLVKVGLALGLVGVCCGLGLASAALVISKTYDAARRASMLVITDACFSVAGFSGAALATTLVAAGVHWTGTYQFCGCRCWAYPRANFFLSIPRYRNDLFTRDFRRAVVGVDLAVYRRVVSLHPGAVLNVVVATQLRARTVGRERRTGWPSGDIVLAGVVCFLSFWLLGGS